MKSVVIVLWVVLLSVSWKLFQSSQASRSSLSWRSHVAIQMGLQEFVENYIQKTLPHVTDIQFFINMV